ncbi:DNA-binding transcriptional MocR family regulator [Aneurinibacillus soli]|uniref:Putative HTH-type transcriptional regulator YdcR n=1 Tax=Aneurinibacillus soli TaxID=1500254 RepID=A0A0U4NBC2_9BACL|nr:PLP-dependent aminotransferase family protein [Aneurinibacillus soli]PYE61241.1 DNA-binding transcriptional MocR family regulator [Aneurinibacillus soli]BAU26324.1 putative HTH-type transcriptional regulator YdcR [Aneurinibacillus soli]
MHKYLQLLNDLETLIGERPYKEGERLPSIRTLAQQYQCSKSTVIRAMDELEKRHMIYSVPKSGYYVVKRMKARKEEGSQVIDFATSAPDPDVFPYLDFQHCINKAIDTYKNDLFIYGMPQGLSSLIQVVQQQLTNYQIFTSEHNIFITSGVQQALSLLTMIPFPNRKKKIVIEQPGYHLFIEHLETHKCPVIGIKRTAEGIDLKELEMIFQTEDIKFFYAIPRFHNPLGTSYTKEEKIKIVELAQKYDVFIVEDDQMADLEQDSKADPLYAYDTSSRVIYLKSYSKIIFPGMRIGVAVIPDALVDVFNRYKKLLDIDSSMLSQGALEIYLKSGMFERHKQKIRSAYARRAKIMADSLTQQSERSGEIFTYHAMKQPCIHTHILLDKKVSLPQMMARLKKQSILLDPIDKHYLSFFPKEKIVKLNVSNVKEEDIERGIEQLIEELKRVFC